MMNNADGKFISRGMNTNMNIGTFSLKWSIADPSFAIINTAIRRAEYVDYVRRLILTHWRWSSCSQCPMRPPAMLTLCAVFFYSTFHCVSCVLFGLTSAYHKRETSENVCGIIVADVCVFFRFSFCLLLEITRSVVARHNTNTLSVYFMSLEFRRFADIRRILDFFEPNKLCVRFKISELIRFICNNTVKWQKNYTVSLWNWFIDSTAVCYSQFLSELLNVKRFFWILMSRY